MPRAIFKRVYIQCSNCGCHRQYDIDITSGTAGLAHQLYQEGWRYNGVSYCPDCVRTWPERNGVKYDDYWRYMEKEFAKHLAEEAY